MYYNKQGELIFQFNFKWTGFWKTVFLIRIAKCWDYKLVSLSTNIAQASFLSFDIWLVVSNHWQALLERRHVLQEVKISLYIARNLYSRRLVLRIKQNIWKTQKHLSLTPWNNFYKFGNDLYSIIELKFALVENREL